MSESISKLEKILKGAKWKRNAALLAIIGGFWPVVAGVSRVADTYAEAAQQQENVRILVDGARDAFQESRVPDSYDQHVIDAAEQYGIDADLLRAMIVVSSDVNPYEPPAEHAGAILVDPVRAGLTRGVLEQNPGMAIDRAARVYSSIQEEERDLTRALSIFYAGQEETDHAIIENADRITKLREGLAATGKAPGLQPRLRSKLNELNWLDNVDNDWARESVYMTQFLLDNPEELRRHYGGGR